MTDTLEEKFLNEINRSMIPHIPHSLIEHDLEARARLTIMLRMENSEGDIKTRKVHTKLIPFRLRSGKDRRRFFQTIRDEWIGVLNKYTKYAVGERGTEAWLRDFMNPEEEMNREDNNEEKSWDYWKIYAIISYKLDIQFPYELNKPTHRAQIMTGSIQHFINGETISSEDWKEEHPDVKDNIEIIPDRKQAEEYDGSNKRIKANARKKHDRRAGFYFDPPTCLQQPKSGCICIDNKDEFCAKYAISAVDNYEKHSEHPRRHKQWEKYFKNYQWKGMNFPSGYEDCEKFNENNPNLLLKAYAYYGATKTTKKQHILHNLQSFYFPTIAPEEMKGKKVIYLLFLFPPEDVIVERLNKGIDDIGHVVAIHDIRQVSLWIQKS